MFRGLVVGVLAALTFSAACSKDVSPTAPSGSSNSPAASSQPTAPPAPPVTNSGSSAMISGTVRTGSGGFGAGFMGVTTTIVVQVVGTDISATASSSGAFTLSGVPPGDITLKISGPGVDGTVSLGVIQTGQTVQVAIVVSGSAPVISADSRHTEGQKRELEGKIQSLEATNRFVLNNVIIQVTPGNTQIRHGSRSLTYADLVVGNRVHVRGTTSVTATETVVMAEWVELQNDATPDDLREIEGRVDSPFPVSGTCGGFPLVFTVGGKTVRAGATTSFIPGCQAIVAGATVEVKGLLQADGAFAATVVKVEEMSAEVEGIVAAITGGSCDAKNLAFTVTPRSGPVRTVTTAATTMFEPSCAKLVVGASVDAKGMLAPDGSILASKVEIEAAEREIEGHVDTPFPVSGSCSSFPLVFKVEGKTVRADASTSFKPACLALAAGAEVEVEGMLQADGVLAATSVKVEEDAVAGTVSALTGGTCDAKNLAFTVTPKNGPVRTVKTSAATKFDESCSKVVAGATVEVEGILQADGSILASKIEIEDKDKPKIAGVDEFFSSFAGACGM
jgi:hypothetical protein